MPQISQTCTTDDIDKAVDALGRLSHTNPADLWGFIGIARKNADNEVFWKTVHDRIVQQGASVPGADSWVSGMKALATGRIP